MGFIKWLYQQYQSYKLEQELSKFKRDDGELFMANYVRCLEVGFSQDQLLALMNLLASCKGETGGQTGCAK